MNDPEDIVRQVRDLRDARLEAAMGDYSKALDMACVKDVLMRQDDVNLDMVDAIMEMI